MDKEQIIRITNLEVKIKFLQKQINTLIEYTNLNHYPTLGESTLTEKINQIQQECEKWII